MRTCDLGPESATGGGAGSCGGPVCSADHLIMCAVAPAWVERQIRPMVQQHHKGRRLEQL